MAASTQEADEFYPARIVFETPAAEHRPAYLCSVHFAIEPDAYGEYELAADTLKPVDLYKAFNSHPYCTLAGANAVVIANADTGMIIMEEDYEADISTDEYDALWTAPLERRHYNFNVNPDSTKQPLISPFYRMMWSNKCYFTQVMSRDEKSLTCVFDKKRRANAMERRYSFSRFGLPTHDL